MSAKYLRVKKWKDHQHYKERTPPWVKMHSRLLRDDSFISLSELEQWQLVRIWMIASQSSKFTHDDKGHVVPVVPADELALRRSILSLKRIPIRKFTDQGWLIEVPETALCDPSGASATIDQRYHGASTALDPTLAPSVHGRTNGASTGASTLLEVEKEKENPRAVTSQVDATRDLDEQPQDHDLEELLRQAMPEDIPF